MTYGGIPAPAPHHVEGAVFTGDACARCLFPPPPHAHRPRGDSAVRRSGGTRVAGGAGGTARPGAPAEEWQRWEQAFACPPPRDCERGALMIKRNC